MRRLLIFFILVLSNCLPLPAQLRIVPTFHCLGIYWSPPGGDDQIRGRVDYRLAGETDWRAAQDLWFDSRRIDGRPAEYRGSIVGLVPGREYEIQLSLEDGEPTQVMTQATTWPEDFPVRKTIHITSSEAPLTISESGSADGYVLYSPAPDSAAVIDVKNQEDFCIYLPEETHHVIIRGFTLRGAARHAIRLSDFNRDIVIENNDISGWGNADSSGYGINLQAAISAPFRADFIERIIIQRNEIHHPNTDANSWGEPRPNPDGDPFHPQGPYGLVFYDTRGNHVIRYNKFYTDDDHYFCDILGAGSNISFYGFPNKDSDIYANYFERCWDDAIEAEGANENVRIWGNTFDHVYHPIGAVVTSVGPLYVWRNLVKRSRKFGHIGNSDDYGRGEFIKCGGRAIDGVYYGDGRMYIYHNTLLQPLPRSGRLSLGCDGAIVAEGRPLYNAVSRNNIFTNSQPDGYTFRDNPADADNCGRNDFDYDLYTGRIEASCPGVIYQAHGVPLAENDLLIFNPAEPHTLMPGTPGFDAGCRLPNFNDDYVGAAPDMGAFESSVDSRGGAAGNANPPGFQLYQNFPNPFSGQTRFLFYLPQASLVELAIFDSLGRRVRLLANDFYAAGFCSVTWDGLNQNNTPVAGGIYVMRLTAEGVFLHKKILLLR